jgi:tetratricopeptide (TPR) repeat protein/tRNA A-37 threonylcarbamoyl transferase component Bud32
VNPGERIGRFEVLGELGAGGMGKLWRARDPKLGREVAIKVVAERHADSREHRARFEQEARAASALNHPGIVTIYDVGEHEGHPYIAMELVEGQSLRAWLAAEPRSPRRVVEVAAQLADALAVAHEHGIVHRDLKPDNVMVTRRGFVKVLDFGLAKLVSRQIPIEESTVEVHVATQVGAIVGTAAYMSPEQARGVPLDHRSDQFALGTMLYEMLAGQRPFRGSTMLDTLSAIIREHPEDPVRLNPAIPPPLADVVRRCLAKEPDARYASTRDLAMELAAIRDALAASGSAASAATGARQAPPGILRGAARRWLALAGLAAVAVLAVAAWVVIARRPAATPPGGSARRVAVLPFRDLSGRPAGALIGEGFAETVSARLAADGGVAVLPAAAVDEAAGDLAALAQRTGAQAVLRGSLQFEGERVRATFALVEPGGRQLAAASVEGTASRLLDLQDEVARRAAAALGLEASPPAAPAAALDLAGDRFLEALGHLRRYEHEAAVDAAIRILEELGDAARVQAALARAYLAKRSLTGERAWAERAIAAATRAAELEPELESVRETRGRIELLLGRPREAAAAFGAALAAQPNAVEAQLGLALALERQGLADGAERAYRRAVAIQPGWWSTHSHLGVFHLRRGELDAAVASFREAVRLSPDNTRAITNLAIAYQQQGRHEAAIAEYERSIAVRPTGAALSNLGTCLFYLARYDDAARAYERAVALQGENAVLWLNLGDARRWSGGSAAETEAAYRRAIGLLRADLVVTPRDPDLLTSLALALAHTAQHAAAREQADAALALDPDGAETLYHVALVRLAGGDTDGALALLERAVAGGYPATEIARDPELARLKSDSRYARLVISQISER